jgi:hypothetical protein
MVSGSKPPANCKKKKKISDSLDTNDRELAVLTKQQHNSFLQASGMREMHLYVVMMLAKNDC